MISAVSASGPYRSSAATLDQDSIKSSGVGYAVLVGISTYKDPSDNLDGVQYDTPHMGDVLINECGYSPTRITTLTDSQATKNAIRSALIQMSSQVGPDDTFVFYFSGHGNVYPSYGGTSYIKLFDSEPNSIKNDISSPELKQWLDGVPCRNVLVIIDACEAEGMMKGGTKDLVTISQVKGAGGKTPGADQFLTNFLGTFETRNNIVQRSEEQQKALTGNQYLVLAACRSGEGSWTTPLSGSFFTTYFVEGIGNPLADINFDNWVSAEEAFYYASPLTSWENAGQHPVLYDGDPLNDLRMYNYGLLPVGRISASSSPSGASIYLDEVNTGFNTPAMLAGISAGSHTVVLRKSGCPDYQVSVVITAGQTASVSAILTAQQTTGSINAQSTPSGATIVLDGMNKGTTPATLTGISAGSHTVVLKKNGYTDYTTSVSVIEGKTASVSATLTGQQTTGSINAQSTPSGATIVLDGMNKGTTPATLTGISAGSHTVV
ncbi:MAG: PEGA domain-containing protein, partial [Methanomicrobiales archaeon]|nr:PEGA domain-containing protein [Methanomicrobiales archaeon]